MASMAGAVAAMRCRSARAQMMQVEELCSGGVRPRQSLNCCHGCSVLLPSGGVIPFPTFHRNSDAEEGFFHKV